MPRINPTDCRYFLLCFCPDRDSSIKEQPEEMSSRDKKPAKPSTSRAGGIRTLSDLNRRSGPDSDSDEEGPQEYYTGGEKSGMLVQDPQKVNDVDSIFNQARQLGAVEGPVDHLRPGSSSTSFAGTGRLLSGEVVQLTPQQPEAVVHNIIFWSNGFTVNDGPLRRLDDPENAPFLESITKSECPKELEPADRRSSVHVNLIKRDEKCPEPEKQPHVAFQGVGRTLGGSAATPVATEPVIGSSTHLNVVPTPSRGVVVDETLPSTSVQLRMADGTRMIANFNYHHTVNDLRAFIDASRPGGAQNYQLQMMGFPPKLLSDPTQTIEQAGLANSVDKPHFGKRTSPTPPPSLTAEDLPCLPQLFSSLFLSSSPDISPLILQFFSPKRCPRKSRFKPRRRASKPLFSLIPLLTLRSAVSRTPGKLTAALATGDFYVRFKGSSKPSRNCGSGFDGEEEAGSVIPTKPHSPLQILVSSLYTHSRKRFLL
ncbi:unnamed protein product [Linum tenue]|uniref:Plant UBX domain-containing protein 4 n=1 Tax=Linum tenue TaxID=586396 RepID=A0AAV0RYP0_9ROSI|nr:unnamed protein product [Linum tenue]